MRSNKIAVRARAAGGRGLFALTDLEPDEILIDFRGSPIVRHPTRISLQVDVDTHIEGSEETNAFLNHSCDPTAYYDYSGVYLRARRGVAAGEEVTVNYNAGDYDLHEKFVCRCGSPECIGAVRGFHYLTRTQQRRLYPFLAPYLRQMVDAA